MATNNIKIGSNSVSSLYIGEDFVEKVYLGTDLIYETDYLIYTLNSDGQSYSVSGIGMDNPNGNFIEIVIPSTYNNKPVTKVGSFKSAIRMTSIVLPNSILSIPFGSFSGCSKLTNFTAPFIGSSRGSNGFSYSIFGYIFGQTDYPGSVSVTSRYNNAGNLVTYKVPSSLRSVTITDETLLSVGSFDGYSMLTSISIGGNITSNSVYSYCFRNCSNMISLTLPNSLTSFNNYCFYGCSSLTEMIIPDTLTSLGSYCFYGCSSLTSISLPSQISRIYDYCFYGCSSLTEMIMNSEEVIIEQYGFGNCVGLTELVIPYTNTTDSSNAPNCLAGCSGLRSLTTMGLDTYRAGVDIFGIGGYFGTTPYEGGIATVQSNGFASTTYYIPEGLTTIHCYKVENYNLMNCTNITTIISDIPIQISEGSIYPIFFGCLSLSSVSPLQFKDSTVYGMFFGTTQFSNTTAVNQNGIIYYIPNSLQNIEINPSSSLASQAFYACTMLKEIVINSGLTSIKNNTFRECSSLEKIIFPAMNPLDGNNGPSIPSASLYGCGALKEMTIPFVGDGRSSGLSTSVFGYIFGTSQFSGAGLTNQIYNINGSIVGYYIPDSLLKVKVLAPSYQEGLPIGAFSYMTQIETIDISSSLIQKVSDRCFYFCLGLLDTDTQTPEFVIPSNITSIGAQAFSYCNFASFCCGDNVTSIGSQCLSDIKYLSALQIPFIGNSQGKMGTVDSVLGYLFAQGTTTISEYKNIIQNYSWFNSLSVYIPKSLNTLIITNETRLGMGSFENFNLVFITLNEGINYIGENCFKSTGINQITLPSTVNQIDDSIFAECPYLSSITTPFIGYQKDVGNNNYLALAGYFWGETSFTGGTSITQNYDSQSSKTNYISSILRTMTVTNADYIRYGAFMNMTMLTTVNLNASVQGNVDATAFNGCSATVNYI